jgi:hypothetical protein
MKMACPVLDLAPLSVLGLVLRRGVLLSVAERFWAWSEKRRPTPVSKVDVLQSSSTTVDLHERVAPGCAGRLSLRLPRRSPTRRAGEGGRHRRGAMCPTLCPHEDGGGARGLVRAPRNRWRPHGSARGSIAVVSGAESPRLPSRSPLGVVRAARHHLVRYGPSSPGRRPSQANRDWTSGLGSRPAAASARGAAAPAV